MTPNISKLDYFAGLAMQGQIQYEGMEGCDCEHIVAMSYQIAAEMVKQSDKVQDTNYQHLASKPQEEIIRTKQYTTEIMDGVEYYIVPSKDAEESDEVFRSGKWVAVIEGLNGFYVANIDKIRRKVKQ